MDWLLQGSVVESYVGACFPGCEVPAWLSHQAYGSVIVLPELSRYWSNNGTTGVALCAVVSFTDYQDQKNRFLVKCTCEFKNADGSLRQLSCTVGGTEPQKIESEHVFIGYTSWLQIKKQKEQEDDKKGYSYSDDHYQASLRFEVTDGTGEVLEKCQVLQCGFSLVYESDETESVSWEVNSNHTDPRMGNNIISPADSKESELLLNDESSRMEEINQEGETNSIMGDKDILGVSLSPADSEEIESNLSDESLRIEEINQQGETNSIMGNKNIHGVSLSPADSEESESVLSNQQDETGSCLSSEDQENRCVQGGLLCLLISISAGAAFILGKRKRK